MPVQPPDSAAPDGVSWRCGLSLPDADVTSFRSMVYGLRMAHDQGLASFEVLIMPTVSMRATMLSSQDAPRKEMAARALEMTGNTGLFDVTGRPACSVPAGRPVGMMIVGKRFDDASALRMAHAFEQAAGGFPAPDTVGLGSST